MVQMSRIFPDSKTFVDMKLKQTPEKTLEYFRTFVVEHPNRTNDDIERFVNVSFKNFCGTCISAAVNDLISHLEILKIIFYNLGSKV